MVQRSVVAEVRGQVVKSERHVGQFPDREDPGRIVTYDFIEGRLLTPEFDTYDVRFPSDGSIGVPEPGKRVVLRCEMRPSGGNLKVTVLVVTPI